MRCVQNNHFDGRMTKKERKKRFKDAAQLITQTVAGEVDETRTGGKDKIGNTGTVAARPISSCFQNGRHRQHHGDRIGGEITDTEIVGTLAYCPVEV